MPTTLYRFFALLVSMFALTASFSLSSSKEDRDVWVFEEVDYNQSRYLRLEDGTHVINEKDNMVFYNYLKKNSHKFCYGAPEAISYAFRIYKKGKEKKQQIIGLVWKNIETDKKRKVVWYNGNFEPLNTPYVEAIQGRMLDLSNENFTCKTFAKDEYIFKAKWKSPHQRYINIKVYYDEQDNIQMDDEVKPWIFECAWNNLQSFERKENTSCVLSTSLTKTYGEDQLEPERSAFEDEIKSLAMSQNIRLDLRVLCYAFRIYQGVKKEQQIIGLVFEKNENNEQYSEKLILYECRKDTIASLDTNFTQEIAKRKVDLSRFSYTRVSCAKDHYVLPIKWLAPHHNHEDLKVSRDTNGNFQIADHVSLLITPDKIFLIKIAVVFVLIGLAIYIYKKGYCSFLSKKSR